MGCAVRWVVRPGDRCGNRDSGPAGHRRFFPHLGGGGSFRRSGGDLCTAGIGT